MRKFLTTLLIVLSLTPVTVPNAGATGVPRPIGGENRIKIINYTPNTVFKFVGFYEYQSIIEFGMDEEIDTISMGTPTPWQIVPAGNRIFIKPVEENATTNMTVITNKRMYFFEMIAEEATGVNDPRLSFVVKFIYPEQYSLAMAGGGGSSGTANGAVTTIDQNMGPDLSKPELYNFKYSISGQGKNIEPLQIFDDGEFTYFKFRDLNSELPAIFLVRRDGREGLVNFRIQGGYVVVERVSDRFTLRHGPDTLCVFNETGNFKKLKKKRFLFF